jgi:hypothetical protein
MAGSRITPARAQPPTKGAKSATQAFMGANQMLDRLAAQVGNRQEAINILIARGHLTADGAWTKEGAARNAMTAAERAKDRASKASGLPTSYYRYDPKTNRATKR